MRARKAIDSLKQELLVKKEATDLFGNERSEALPESSVQSTKPLADRISIQVSRKKPPTSFILLLKIIHLPMETNESAPFLFLLFLQINGQLGKKYFDNKALVALTLLIAASDPGQKDLLIRLIVNLLSGE